MKKNRNFVILFVILAIITLVLWLSQSPNTFRRSLSNFKLDDSSNVTKIFIGDKNNNSVILTKIGFGKWMVDDKFPAQKLSVELLLKTMVDIEVSQPVAKAAHDNIIKEMAVNAVKVEIYQQVYRLNLFGRIKWWPHEKLTKVFYVGGATPDNQGCFMLIEHSSEPYIVFLPGFRGFVSPRFSPIEKYWRDYNVFKTQIPEIASVKVEVPETPQYSYLVKNNGNDRFSIFSISDNKPLPGYDTLKLLNFLSGFRNLNYEALINDMDKTRKDSIIASTPFIIITLTDKAGISKTIKTYHKKGPDDQTDPDGRPMPYDLDRLYALVNDGRDFTLIQYYNFDKVLRPLPFFIKESTDK
ncbi:MAG: hypothetical protein WCP32_09975 [Bacteroidota bacterium]